ncbi:High-affinity methionine permease [Fulvia fulva]|uniref:High-affinity methionine permease n=1 Tax=Passalora fulva TaxID=5499 RepID=A0A9Q8PD05_PASFU|nr:High-affinity methionine permease [Fulvia fulva]UJO20152.1 High-affinity methionine permease [Fulvia fulva]
MPLNANEEALIGKPSTADLDYEHQRVEYAPEEQHKIGKWTLVALILNRTIGSGIFLTPHRILTGVGCVGGALCVWVLGALISICGLYVWLECGLSMPQRRVRVETEPRGVPRSGGDKNYLEFMFPNRGLRLPHFRTTCSFSIMFLLMYILSGNAISFAIQVMTASGHYDRDSGDLPPRGIVIGIAISALSLVVLLHAFSRNIGIFINNGFAIIKVALLLTIICLGIAKAAGKFGGPGDVQKDVGSWSNSLLLCMYAFSGYEQPFYVLAETKSPRKNGTPRLQCYLLVVDKSEVLPEQGGIPDSFDLATLFFDNLWKNDHQGAARAMAAVIAVSIFGNLWEIAKEGILPFSLIIATSYRTPSGMLKRAFSRNPRSEEQVEQATTATFGLHWLTSVVLIAATAPILDPRRTYSILISLYSYTIILVLGFWVSFGLVMTKFRKSQWHWQERRRSRPWLSPAHAIIYCIATAFMLVAAFVPSQRGSPFHESVTGLPWYLIPAIGITGPFWGLLWYGGFRLYESKMRCRQLVVTREAYWARDPGCPGEYVQLAEIIDHTWEVATREDMSDEFEKPRTALLEHRSTPMMRMSSPSKGDGSDGQLLEEGKAGGRVRDQDVGIPRRLSDSF